VADAVTTPEIARVLHGRGQDLGPYATRFPLEQSTVVRLLRTQAERYGDKVWLNYDGRDFLTYADGLRLANKTANAILETVGPGKHVGLYMRNQVEFSPAENGAIAVGVAVPLNADARGPLLQSQIERADVELLIVRQELLHAIEALDSLGQVALVVVVGDGDIPAEVVGVRAVRWSDWLDGQPETLDHPEPAHTDLAVIAFTSGTTGRAKGVMYSHYFHFLFSAIIADSLEHTEEDVLTSPLPQHHRGSAHLIANAALQIGGVGCLQERFTASGFWAAAARDGATYAFLLGPVAALIDKAMQPEDVPEHRVRSIYCLPAPPNKQDWEKKFRTKILSQGWAMTEIFPCLNTQHQLEGVPDDTIGWPVKWFDYGVVDGDDNMVAPGETGELVMRCLIPYGMFSGYYKDGETTAEAFRNFWFHTGDSASYDEDGMLRFRGRLKDRIRRRGEMVTAGEVEYVAVLHPAVKEAAAYGVPEELGEEDVKLDVVLKEPLELAEYHGWLTENLPRYMVPRYLEIREEFPKTPSLRIEKYKLQQDPVDRPGVFDAGPGGKQPAS
jgi:crotonobetaine/carnitine-CoA ligase